MYYIHAKAPSHCVGPIALAGLTVQGTALRVLFCICVGRGRRRKRLWQRLLTGVSLGQASQYLMLSIFQAQALPPPAPVVAARSGLDQGPASLSTSILQSLFGHGHSPAEV
jgi:hypothetical protein